MGSWLGSLFYGLITFLGTSLGKITMFLVAPIVGFFGLILKLITMAQTYFDAMITEATNAAGQASSLSLGTFVGLANHFVPLDLIMEYCGLLVGIWMVGLVYRAIKSFIPTLS